MSLYRSCVRLVAALLLALSAFSATAACPRIVSQSPYITRALVWMGLEACIVGVSRYDALDRPRTGGVLDPDADAIALLDPQLMITADWTPREAWQAAAPKGAVALRVDGFHGMADVEAMLRAIGRAAGAADIDARVDRYAADWRAAAARVGGKGQRALILSVCSERPYSYGRGTTLFELFTAAGFDVVADHDGIRNFRIDDGPPGEFVDWINLRYPDLIFALKNRGDAACNASMMRPGTMIVPLQGEHFIHPGPDLLLGLQELREAVGP